MLVAVSSSSRGLRSSRVICSTLQVVWVSLWYNLPALGLGVSNMSFTQLGTGQRGATYSSKSNFSLLFLIPKINLMLPFCECADLFPIPRLYNHPNGLPSSPINLSVLCTQVLLQISCWYGILLSCQTPPARPDKSTFSSCQRVLASLLPSGASQKGLFSPFLVLKAKILSPCFVYVVSFIYLLFPGIHSLKRNTHSWIISASGSLDQDRTLTIICSFFWRIQIMYSKSLQNATLQWWRAFFFLMTFWW